VGVEQPASGLSTVMLNLFQHPRDHAPQGM